MKRKKVPADVVSAPPAPGIISNELKAGFQQFFEAVARTFAKHVKTALQDAIKIGLRWTGQPNLHHRSLPLAPLTGLGAAQG